MHYIELPSSSNISNMMLGNQYYYIMQEVEEYFTNYIVNESLGIIANAHVVFADKEPLKAER